MSIRFLARSQTNNWLKNPLSTQWNAVCGRVSAVDTISYSPTCNIADTHIKNQYRRPSKFSKEYLA